MTMEKTDKQETKENKRNSGVREAILFMKQEQDAIKIDGSESKTNVLGN